jgi:starch-binding outer membrane protein, SusD/RagB family
MKRYKILTLAIIALIAVNGCVKDLDVVPSDPNVVTSATVYDNPESWKMVLAKCYAGLAVSGQQGPAGKPDISDIDEGFSTYLRQYWCASELPTDEAVISWNDAGLKDYHNQNWAASNPFITAMYNRIYYQVSLLNEYIRAINSKIGGLSGTLQSDVAMFRAEARFLRAFSYWHALDLFGSIPFVTDADAVGAFLPKQATKAELFNYIESELLAIESELAEPGTNEYGRVDQAAAWTLLAKLYLNAEVYIGTPKYTECITYCNNVINSGYSLDPVYAHIFMADNNLSPEVIFPVAFDGNSTRTWGGMTFVIHAAVGGSMSAASFGIDNGWGGTRVTSAFVKKFSDPTGTTDTRAMFYTSGQSLEIADLSTFTDGYAVTKFTNMKSAGGAGSNATYPDTDYPVFRLADVYLMYAEAVLRGGTGGSTETALGYVNALRERAYGDASGNITTGELTLPFVLDERSRELYWEGHRRTDLVRYGLLTSGTYLWPWKGGVAGGVATDAKYNIMPIPSSDIGANPTLVQNDGY